MEDTLAIIAVFGTAAWVAWLIFNAVRLFVEARSQAAAQDKLLLRVSSPESLQIFLASAAGGGFLRALERNPNEVWRGIIRTTQTAVTFAVLGAGVLAIWSSARPTAFSSSASGRSSWRRHLDRQQSSRS